MDFNELTLEQLIDAMKRTPSLALLKRLRDEIARFPAERDSLERIYKNQYRQFERSMTLRGRYGKCTLYWKGHVPYGYCEWSVKLDKDLIFWDESMGDRIEYLRKLRPDMHDITDDYRWDRLMNPGLGTMPQQISGFGTTQQVPPFITGKLRKAVKSTIFVPVPQETIEEIDKIHAAEREEIEREREIDRKNKEKRLNEKKNREEN